jgi:hypothetical protein
MFLFDPRPFLKIGFVGVSVCVLFSTVAAGQTSSESFSVSQPLLNLSSTPAFAVQNFNPSIGTLTDVTLSLKVAGKKFTIFDTNNPGADWVNLFVGTPGAAKVSADALNAWGDSLGNINLTYQKPQGKSVASMGIAGLLLYCTPKNGAAPYISVNYTYDISGNNGNATPEPGANYLSSIAAGAMILMLIGRSLRRRAGAKSGTERGEIPALALS